MKKLFCVWLAALLLCSLTACGTKDNKDAEGAADTPSASQTQSADGIDVDLTALSSTMVYSEVYSMMSFPDNYIGKTVKMQGQFAVYQATDESGAFIPDQIYFACVIADATACCSQGLEFILAGEHSYPADYPELGTDITVTGTFQLYQEGEGLYCHLTDAVME